MENFVIAITRTCGSGGTTVGRLLAEEYGIDMYNRELLRLASKDSGINQSLFEAADEDMKKSILFHATQKVYTGEMIPPESKDFTSNDNLFNFQAKVLKELCMEESYVVIGRAADYVLKDYPFLIRVFIHASHERCVSHQMDMSSIDRKEAEDMIARLDAYRAAYYKYHTGKRWFDVRNYDLVLDTSNYSYEQCKQIIQNYVELKRKFLQKD